MRALVAAVFFLAGCGAPSPQPGYDAGFSVTGRTCSQLGWECGIDDYGARCGTCATGRTCAAGVCVRSSPMCSCGTRVCGVDNCGNSCGVCPMGQSCSATGQCTGGISACMSPIAEYRECNDATALCCAPSTTVPGRTTVCVRQTGVAYCAITCTGASDCVTVEQRANLAVGQLTCTPLSTGSSACLLNPQVTQRCTAATGPFGRCALGTNDQCCGYHSSGVGTLCSTDRTGNSYCAPRCMSNTDCDRLSGLPGSFVCDARRDGVRVCFPR